APCVAPGHPRPRAAADPADARRARLRRRGGDLRASPGARSEDALRHGPELLGPAPRGAGPRFEWKPEVVAPRGSPRRKTRRTRRGWVRCGRTRGRDRRRRAAAHGAPAPRPLEPGGGLGCPPGEPASAPTAGPPRLPEAPVATSARPRRPRVRAALPLGVAPGSRRGAVLREHARRAPAGYPRGAAAARRLEAFRGCRRRFGPGRARRPAPGVSPGVDRAPGAAARSAPESVRSAARVLPPV